MPIDEPPWWYAGDTDPRAQVLRPLSQLYGWVATRRMSRPPRHRSSLPVVCIGNFTAGGTGKTPLTQACRAILAARNLRAAVLSRGHSGRARGPRRIDPDRDRAEEVGDEPLLLARTGDVFIARDRVAGARMIEAADEPYDLIVMDDGLQNPDLAKDLTLAVVDSRRGIGNAEVIPSGPLRAPMEAQLPCVDAIVVNRPPGSDDDPGAATWLRRHFEGPVLTARPEGVQPPATLLEHPVVAFAGIANPARFFDLLKATGVTVSETIAYRDHHAFTEGDAQALLAKVANDGRQLVTTEKDWVRLLGHAGARGALAQAAYALPFRLAFSQDDAKRLDSLLDGAISRARVAD